MTDKIADIAAGLSKAQRGWLDNAWYGSRGWQINYRPKACELGLAFPKSSKLTPLGLAVRQHLKENSDDR